MKNHYLLLVLFALLSKLCAAQTTGWHIPTNNGLPGANPNLRFDDIYFFDKDTGMLVSYYGKIYKTYNGGNDWTYKPTPTNPQVYPYFRSIEFLDNGQYGITGTLGGFIFRTDDRGETWTDISAAVSDTGMKRICGLAHWNNTFYGVGWWGSEVARLYKSTDAGQTWTTTYLDTSLATGLVDVICLSADTILATGCRLYRNGTKLESVVIKSVNAGNTWTKVFSDTTIGGKIWKIQFLDKQFGVGSIEPLYSDTVAMIKTTDGGNTWHIIPIGSQVSSSWGTQGIGFLNHQKGWVGGYYNGLFETNDGGLSWNKVFPAAMNANRFFRINDSTMLLSGAALYLYLDSMQGSHTGVAAAPQASASDIKLYPVIPNPSRGKIKIEFDIDRSTNSLIEIIDLSGRTVHHVSGGYLQPGHYTYTWDGTNMPRGNYIVWLGTDIAPIVQKFTLY